MLNEYDESLTYIMYSYIVLTMITTSTSNAALDCDLSAYVAYYSLVVEER